MLTTSVTPVTTSLLTGAHNRCTTGVHGAQLKLVKRELTAMVTGAYKSATPKAPKHHHSNVLTLKYFHKYI